MHCALSPSLKHYFEGHVLISGIISFTVDNSETQFDERIDDVRQMKGLAAGKKVFVPEVFSSTNGYDSNDKFNKWPLPPFFPFPPSRHHRCRCSRAADARDSGIWPES
jgi:hypothetical protein